MGDSVQESDMIRCVLRRHHRSVVRVGIEESQGTGNPGDAWPGSVREGFPQEVKSER